jgi:cyanate lyase
MTRADLTEKMLDIRREHGWSWAHVAEAIGGLSPVLITAAILGEMRLPRAQCARARELFGLTEAEERLLHEPPMRGRSTPMPPTDPLIYRFYELVMVYGAAWKELIQEEFGDGIMSAIDFEMSLEREPNIAGDRVRLSMTGKFLPYRYYGAQQGTPANGLKETE